MLSPTILTAALLLLQCFAITHFQLHVSYTAYRHFTSIHFTSLHFTSLLLPEIFYIRAFFLIRMTSKVVLVMRAVAVYFTP